MRTLRFYRQVEGRRVRWRMDLDETNCVTFDGPDAPIEIPVLHPQEDGVNVIPENASPSQRAYYAALIREGYRFRVREDGKTDILYTPPIRLELAKFFALDIPCWFPECEALRTQYREALEKASSTGEASDCRGCDQAAIMGQFQNRVLPFLQAHLAANAPSHHNPSHPRVGTVSGSALTVSP